jgi:hypothetical protein
MEEVRGLYKNHSLSDSINRTRQHWLFLRFQRSKMHFETKNHRIFMLRALPFVVVVALFLAFR